MMMMISQAATQCNTQRSIIYYKSFFCIRIFEHNDWMNLQSKMCWLECLKVHMDVDLNLYACVFSFTMYFFIMIDIPKPGWCSLSSN